MAGPGGQEVGRVSVRVVPNTEHFRRELKAQLEAIEDSLKAEIEVEPDTAGFREKVRAATSNLPDAKVKVDVDRSTLDRVRDGLGGLFDNLRPSGGGGGRGFVMPFIDNLALVAAVAAIAAPAIALATGALAALPSVLAGVLVPIGAIALGMEGIGRAAVVFAEPIAALKESLSKTFEDRFTPIFTSLAGVLPQLDGPLNVVANGISDVVESIGDMIVSEQGMNRIKGTIENIGQAISDSAPGLTDLTNGLLGLAEGVSRKFPAVATWVNKVGDSFANWVDKVLADGSLDRAMGNFGDTLKEVFDLLGDVAKQGFEWLQDPKFAESMKTFVSDLRSLVNDVLPGLGSFFQDLTSALDGIVATIDTIKSNKPPEWMLPDSKAANEPSKTGAGGRDNGTDLLPQWKENLANLVSSVNLPLLLANQFREGNAFDGALAGLKQKFVATFQGIGTAIVPAMTAAFTNIQTVAAAAWNGLVSVAANVVSQVISTFAQIPGRIGGALSAVPGVVAGVFAQAVSTVASAGAQMIAAIVNVGAQIVAEVASWGGKVAAAAQSIATALVGIGPQMIAGFLSGFEGAAANALSVVSSWASRIGAVARSALGINSPSRVFTEIGAQTAQGLENGLEGGFQGVIERATILADKLSQAVNDGLQGVDGGVLNDAIKQQLDELEIQRKRLKVDKNALPKEDKEGRAALQTQMDQIQALKDQLGLQKDQLGFSGKYADNTDSVSQANNIITEQIASMIDLAKGFFNATSGQFMSDLGMSGNGAIPSVANQMLDWGAGALSKHLSAPFSNSGVNINVNSVDEALAARTNIVNKDSLRYRQR